MTPHPLSQLFPMMSEPDLVLLAKDIKENGQHEPIVMLDGMVLDGRNRWNACKLAGVEPYCEDYDGLNPLTWVISLNLHRRHLSTSQRAMVAAALVEQLQQRAELPGRPRDQAATMLNVSPRLVQDAMRVRREAAPEVIRAVEQNEVKVSAAAKLTTLTPEDQAEAVQGGERSVKAATKRAAATKKKAKLDERTEVAAAAAPDSTGIDLRCCDVSEILAEVTGAALIHSDSPWSYNNSQNGAAHNHYETLTVEQIIAHHNAAFDCALDHSYMLVWNLGPLLEEWFEKVAKAKAAGEWRWRYLSKGAWGKREDNDDRKGTGYHWRGDSEDVLLYAKGKPNPFWDNCSNSSPCRRTKHSEKPLPWLRDLVRTFAPKGGLVVDLYAGLAPLARACRSEGRRYIGAELDPGRHREALEALEALEAT